ncbi:SRPBCC family protein [Methylocystis sp. ATCC 49242]|uniref:SRPBCC family protein n=1 Tax=Methylocystis sp. ATCC 49242 TaxID=622637 RepID=UPI0001F87812|nr:SRPBCC family protein [Methylocystis sp. ATCC 49242]
MSFVIARRAVVVAALSLVSAAVVSAPAFAHGPSRQKVVEKIEIDAPADKVWGIVGNFQDLNWHPSVASTEGTGGSDVGAKRKITLKNGGVIEESATKVDAAGKSLSYKIDNVDVKVVPVNNYSSTISVKEEGGKSVVEWKGAFYRGFMNNDPPPELSDEAAVKAVSDFYKAGLAALKAKAEGK